MTAKDGGEPPKTDTMVVNITVTDVNDNSPQFPQTSYSTSIPEDQQVNVTVLQVDATDRDVGQNAEISYKFGTSVSGNVRDKFNIIPNTGEVSSCVQQSC